MALNRRRFLSLFGAGVAGVALEQAIPLGRVWSFPKEIAIPRPDFIARYLDPAAAYLAQRVDFMVGDIISIDNVPGYAHRTFRVSRVDGEYASVIKLEAIIPAPRRVGRPYTS